MLPDRRAAHALAAHTSRARTADCCTPEAASHTQTTLSAPPLAMRPPDLAPAHAHQAPMPTHFVLMPHFCTCLLHKQVLWALDDRTRLHGRFSWKACISMTCAAMTM